MNLNNKNKHRFRRTKFLSGRTDQNTEECGFNKQRTHSAKHPSHLKGKEIGLFYAKLNENKRRKNQQDENKDNNKQDKRNWRDKHDQNTIGKVILSETRQNFIESTLKNMDLIGQMFITDDGSYDHVTDSSFKQNFLQTIHGSIYENLKQVPESERDPNLDRILFNELSERQTESAYQYMLKFRTKLPCFSQRAEILRMINENQVVVISGETGCGKTTQVAQFILDDYILQKKGSICRIVCTQPRRISAVSVSERVAEERAEKLGKSVGYCIRLEKVQPRDKGSIVFCTTGVVLKWMENDPCLGNISHIILDEIHERDVMSDFLIALLKTIINHRKDLKVILMSATLNAEKFSSYFNNCPHISIPGFTYPVEEFYLEDVLEMTGFEFQEYKSKKIATRKSKRLSTKKEKEWSDFIEPYIRNLEAKRLYSRHVCKQLRNPDCEKINIDLIMSLLIHICENDYSFGAILVFLSGLSEISALINLMEKSGRFPSHQNIIIPLHSLLCTVDQKKVFDRPPSGVRKIVVATNIAETSITIDDVVFVIDCGKIKMSNYNVQTDTQTLLPEWVSLANANQRKGRAGRTQPGVCYHLFTKIRRITLEDYQQPEVLRKRLEDTILTLKLLKLGKTEPFLNSLLDCPNPKAVETSIRLLIRLNALDNEERLTPLGYHLAKLPMAPQMGKMILMGAIFGCLDPILSIAATLDFKDAFKALLGKEKELNQKKLELTNQEKNDHLVFIEAMRQYEKSSNKKRFCYDYFLSPNTMTLLKNMKQQFMEYLYEMNFVSSSNTACPECNFNSDNKSLIQAVVCSGLYPNIAVMRKKRSRFSYSLKTMEDNATVKFHPKSIMSCMADKDFMGTNIVVYHLKLKSSKTFLHDASIVNPLSLLFFGDMYIQNDNSEQFTIGVGRSVNFKTNTRTAAIIKELRNRLNWFLEYKAANPGPVAWDKNEDDTKLLKAIIELITSEDKGELSDSENDCYFVEEEVGEGADKIIKANMERRLSRGDKIKTENDESSVSDNDQNNVEMVPQKENGELSEEIEACFMSFDKSNDNSQSQTEIQSSETEEEEDSSMFDLAGFIVKDECYSEDSDDDDVIVNEDSMTVEISSEDDDERPTASMSSLNLNSYKTKEEPGKSND